MPYAAPYQSIYPQTRQPKNKPMGVWGGLFDNGQPAEKLYGGNQKFGQPHTGMYGANPALAGRLWQSPMQQVPSTPMPMAPYASRGYPGTLGASRAATGGRYAPAGAGGGYGGFGELQQKPAQILLNDFFDRSLAAGGAQQLPGYSRLAGGYGQGVPGMAPQAKMAGRYYDNEFPSVEEHGLGRTPVGSLLTEPLGVAPEGAAPGDMEALKAAYMRRRDAQFLNPVNPNQERMAQLTGVPLSESLAYARANMQPVGRGTVPSVGSANPSLASINNINAQMLTDPTVTEAQFSSQLGQPTNDELALKAWNESRGKGGFTREGALANANRGAFDPATGGYRTATSVYDAISNPNFNQNGAQFGGAGLAMDSRGRVSFTDRERGPDPGAAAREERRLAHMAQLKARQGDDRQPQPYLRQGVSYPALTPDGTQRWQDAWQVRDDRKTAQAERMARVTERASAMAEQRKENLAARRRGPSVMDMLAQRNPELAVRLAEGQQRGQMFQQGLQAQQERDAQNAQARLAEVKAQADGNLGVANKDYDGKVYVADAEMKAAEAKLKADQEAAANRLAAEQRASGMAQYGQWAVANPNATPQEKNEMWAALISGQQAQPAAAGGWGGLNVPPQAQPNAVPGGIVDRLQQPQGGPPVAQGPFSAPQGAVDETKPIYAGGKINEQQLGVIKAAADKGQWDKALTLAMSMGLTQAEAEDLVNGQMVGNTWWRRTKKTPSAFGRFMDLITPEPGGYVGPPAGVSMGRGGVGVRF